MRREPLLRHFPLHLLLCIFLRKSSLLCESAATAASDYICITSAQNSLCFSFSHAASKESEITFKCGTANDEETKAERGKNASRGN